uniref:ATPase AAA-type core domain-containing protein n=1 Tax=viral metagenome TaxID=1070528 RepID=A0A6C0CQP5_9ZZZZ
MTKPACDKQESNHRKSARLKELNKTTTLTTDNKITLDQIITLIESTSYRKHQKTGIENLQNVLEELKELQKMVGMSQVKQTVVEHVLYLAQNLSSENDMNHIQITGDPGIGKTTLAEILGRIYARLGLLESEEVYSVTRADLIGEHLGSTAIKTMEALELCIGRVMLIDEVYSFGAPDKRDSFSKECIDTITQFLSEHRDDMLCIIAGYEQDIQDCVFSMNKGLERRFPWKYSLQSYSLEDLKNIFISQIEHSQWSINVQNKSTETILNTIFSQQNQHYFEFSGGDTEILFTRCKIAHSSNLFVKANRKKRTLNSDDLLSGFAMYQEYKNASCQFKKKHQDKITVGMMYC